MITIPIWLLVILIAFASPLLLGMVVYIVCVICDLLFIHFYYEKTSEQEKQCPYEIEGRHDEVQ